MSLVQNSTLHQLINDHQSRYEQYEIARQKAEDQAQHTKEHWYFTLNTLFVSHVLPQLESVKGLLAEHGFESNIVVQRKAIQAMDGSVADAITQITFSLSGLHSSDNTLIEQNNNINRLLFFTAEHSMHIHARYITDIASSETQMMYFLDENATSNTQRPPWAHTPEQHQYCPPCYDHGSESHSVISDFINFVFLQIRGKLNP